MSLLSFWLASQEEKKKSTRMIIQIIFFVLLALAIFLAVKDLGLLTNSTTKVGVILLAAFFPDLYILLHLISTSSMGVGFFSGSPVESKMSGDWFKPSSKSASGGGGGWGRSKSGMGGGGAPDMGMPDMGMPGGDMSSPTPTVSDSSSSLF